MNAVQVACSTACVAGAVEGVGLEIELLGGREGATVHRGLQLALDDEKLSEVECKAHEPEQHQQKQGHRDDDGSPLASTDGAIHDRSLLWAGCGSGAVVRQAGGHARDEARDVGPKDFSQRNEQGQCDDSNDERILDHLRAVFILDQRFDEILE